MSPTSPRGFVARDAHVDAVLLLPAQQVLEADGEYKKMIGEIAALTKSMLRQLLPPIPLLPSLTSPHLPNTLATPVIFPR